MRTAIRLASLLILVAAFSAPASAKTCKAAVSGKGLSTATAAADKREARARAGAIAKWRKAAHAKYGLAYRFWSRADARKVDCRKGKEVTRCTITAKPCRVL